MRREPALDKSASALLGRRRLLQFGGLGVAALGAGGLLAACGGSSSSSGKGYGKLAIQLSWIKNIEFAGEYFADAKGYYSQAGFSGVDLIASLLESRPPTEQQLNDLQKLLDELRNRTR